MESKHKSGIVILAAGASKRLGRPKQLLQLNEETLLNHTINKALNSEADFVILILGESMKGHINLYSSIKRLTVFYHKNWERGMGSSIKFGLEKSIQLYPSAESIIFSVCDQPYINKHIFNQLFQQGLSNKEPIIASEYNNGAFGIPVLFKKSFFNVLSNCSDGEGAKRVIKNNIDNVSFVSFEKGNFDIDTEEDYQYYLNNFN